MLGAMAKWKQVRISRLRHLVQNKNTEMLRWLARQDFYLRSAKMKRDKTLDHKFLSELMRMIFSLWKSQTRCHGKDRLDLMKVILSQRRSPKFSKIPAVTDCWEASLLHWVIQQAWCREARTLALTALDILREAT
ncbi:hypothetical protein CSKR_202860 [Clonorchis sinensis]|uniref:Uncharacterized protein n=1 Tax=Clonorchis sinensis TaxID=79923 RepID=A0A8T1M3G4_CLOSI|nr:hypothetical protein CSKR_202860 [Clonorchis sinensis]